MQPYLLTATVGLLGTLILTIGPSARSRLTVSSEPLRQEQSQDTQRHAQLAKLPLSFEANHGQAHPEARFLARGPGYTLFLAADEAVLSLKPAQPRQRRNRVGARMARSDGWDHPQSARSAIRLKLADANPAVEMVGVEELATRSNYFIGDDPGAWRSDIPHYGKVRYRQVYPGIDLLFYGNQGQLEFDFEVAPGADSSKIHLVVEGGENLTADPAGNLLLEDGAGAALTLHKPFVYQEEEGRRVEVAGAYRLEEHGHVRFDVGPYDASRTLVLDPVVAYSTYLGGTLDDLPHDVAVDAEGSVYIVGETDSLDFPLASPMQGASAGSEDVFVAKMNSSGTALVYSTYLGGSNSDSGFAIGVDGTGTPYIAGATSSINFPTMNAFQSSFGGSPADGFVARLNATGTGLIFSTYLGGNGFIVGDVAQALALDSDGNVYVAGTTDAFSFPTTPNAFQPGVTLLDAFVSKLDPAGSSLIYSTLYGGGGLVFGDSIAVDGDGNAYISGYAFLATLPVVNPIQALPGGGTCGANPCGDAFIAKFNAAGSNLEYSTYLGGNGEDEAVAIAVDASGSAHVTGLTDSTNFPRRNAVQPVKGASFDAFVAKLSPDGSSLVYSTYLGGNGSEGGFDIVIGPSGNAHIAGQSGSNGFPIQEALQSVRGGNFDVTVTSMSGSGSLLFSTYWGGH